MPVIFLSLLLSTLALGQQVGVGCFSTPEEGEVELTFVKCPKGTFEKVRNTLELRLRFLDLIKETTMTFSEFENVVRYTGDGMPEGANLRGVCQTRLGDLKGVYVASQSIPYGSSAKRVIRAEIDLREEYRNKCLVTIESKIFPNDYRAQLSPQDQAYVWKQTLELDLRPSSSW